MSEKVNPTSLLRMKRALQTAFEGLLSVAPELELTRRQWLDEDRQRRFFARIELRGVEPDWDFSAVVFKITAAQLGIMNTRVGWENFLYARKVKSGTLL